MSLHVHGLCTVVPVLMAVLWCIACYWTIEEFCIFFYLKESEVPFRGTRVQGREFEALFGALRWS